MSDFSPATIAAARKLGPRPALTRNVHGKLYGPLSTAAQDKIVRTWIESEAGTAFRIGNVMQVADARAFLRDVAEKLHREDEALERCPHALHTMLSSPRVRELVGDPSLATPEQAEFVLTECMHPAKHRGRHASQDGSMSWTGKLTAEEMEYANKLRTRRDELQGAAS